jgi:hypothetical protein
MGLPGGSRQDAVPIGVRGWAYRVSAAARPRVYRRRWWSAAGPLVRRADELAAQAHARRAHVVHSSVARRREAEVPRTHESAHARVPRAAHDRGRRARVDGTPIDLGRAIDHAPGAVAFRGDRVPRVAGGGHQDRAGPPPPIAAPDWRDLDWATPGRTVRCGRQRGPCAPASRAGPYARDAAARTLASAAGTLASGASDPGPHRASGRIA